ncbi:hypothetical protein Adt_07815 [Abeliophyllum distichum]|uniref:Uncharacterized protein n=1 Tax=Abeliophyllum distichum TaxID=126358 RepID=A0ABD1VAV3_9LAMI
MSSEVGSDSGREAMSWGRGQEEESSSGRLVEGIDNDEVLSPAPLKSVPPTSRSTQKPGDQFGFPCPSVGEFNSLYSFKSDGRRSGWWYASVKPRTGGSVVTQTPDSIKTWKQFWFYVQGPWQFSINDTGPHVNIPVRYHELRYTSHEPTPEFVERARQVRAVDESFRSSSVLITEENLASARLSSTTSSNSRPSQSGKQMKDISALLKKKGQAGKGKRKAPSEGQPPASRPRTQEEEVRANVPSPARSVEEITSFPIRGEPSSSPACCPPPTSSQIPPKPSSRVPPTYLGSTPERDEEYLKLHGSIPKPLRDFFRSNSPTRGDIVELPSSARRAISVLSKSWTPDQQKYLEGMGTVESIVAASVNTSRAAIQLTSAVEKMGRMLNDIQVMREEGRKVQAELSEEKRLRALSEDILLRREEELRKKEDELKAMSDELEVVNKSKADLEHDLEGERKSNAELKAALEKSADKDEAVAEFRSSNAYLAEQEMVYFLTMEELIETTSEKLPDWDVQFLRDELSDLKRKSTLNPPSPEEVEPDQAGAEE